MILDCIKSNNQCVNTIVFPGSLWHPTYTAENFNLIYNIKLIFIPFKYNTFGGSCTNCTSMPTKIPALLYINNNNSANKFCINFHGNGCDIGQISICAAREGKAFNAHYLLVEYPRYGISDGHPNEFMLNEVATSIFEFVEKELKVDHSRIIIVGRSIGTGPACYLASHLQALNKPVAALLLQSPFCSIKDVAFELLGCAGYFLLDRWQNWKILIGDYKSDSRIIQSPVLFIHADRDNVIDCNHSILMHEYRSRCGLISELFIQKSDALFIKGHNYFDYDRDVVSPSKDFLHRFVDVKNPHLHTGAVNSNVIKLPMDLIATYSIVPSYLINKYTDELKMKYATKSSSILRSMKCTPDVYVGWCLCPCLFCTECTIGAIASSSSSIITNSFDYKNLKPNTIHKNTLWKTIFQFDKFNRHVGEAEAAHCANLRKQQHHIARHSTHASNESQADQQHHSRARRTILNNSKQQAFIEISESSNIQNPLLQAGNNTDIAMNSSSVDHHRGGDGSSNSNNSSLEEGTIRYIPG